MKMKFSMELARTCWLPKHLPLLHSIFLSFIGLWVKTGTKPHFLNQILCKAADLNLLPVLEKGIWSDSNQTAQLLRWLNFFFPILEYFCPLLVQIAQMGLILPRWGLILPRWGLILPRIPPPTPVLYLAVTNPFLGYVRIQNTPYPTPKRPFSWLELKNGQNQLPSGQFWPQLGKMFKKLFMWLQTVAQPWAWALKKSPWGLRFFCIFEKSGKNEATDLAVSQLRGSTIAIISAHVPGPHMWASAGPGTVHQFKFSKTVEVWW